MADIAWRNGVLGRQWQSRHPSPGSAVPIGLMADIGMPVDLTFSGRPYDDSNLLRLAAAFEAIGSKQAVPPRTSGLIR